LEIHSAYIHALKTDIKSVEIVLLVAHTENGFGKGITISDKIYQSFIINNGDDKLICILHVAKKTDFELCFRNCFLYFANVMSYYYVFDEDLP
jgi:hypothetical protein